MSEPGSATTSLLPPGAKCAVHPTMRALITCTRCGNFACAGCRAAPGSSLCKACAQKGGATVASDPETAERIRKQLRKYNLTSFAIALPGMLLAGVGRSMTDGHADAQTEAASNAVSAIGQMMFIVGLGFYARMKGRSGINGLWGLLSCIGFIVLYFMKKHCHACKQPAGFRSTQCPQCGAPM